MWKQFLCSVALLIISTSSALGGLRGPGEYHGVVYFDRWDTCYLYDGVFLMYISEKVKERLRQYEGQTIRIDAKEVYQPMNPGDGLIKSFEFLGLANDRNNPELSGLALSIIPDFEIDGTPQFTIEVKNNGKRKLEISNESLAPTLFGEKDEWDTYSPSDGKSTALITRSGFAWAKGEHGRLSGSVIRNGQEVRVERWYGVKIDEGQVQFDSFTLGAGQVKVFKAAILASPGLYEFLVGYTRGLPGSEGRISNSIFFNINEDGKASLISESKQDFLLRASSQVTRQKQSRSISFDAPLAINRFSWAAMARAIGASLLALLIFNRFYRS